MIKKKKSSLVTLKEQDSRKKLKENETINNFVFNPKNIIHHDSSSVKVFNI